MITNDYEGKALKLNMPLIFLMATVGIVFGYLSGSNAIVTDGLYSLIIFISIVVANKINPIVGSKISHDFPKGKGALSDTYLQLKLFLLLGFLIVSFTRAVIEIVGYEVGVLSFKVINENYANIYYVIKGILVVISLSIYTYFLRKSKISRCRMLVVERLSVIIDGVITASIFIGFLIFKNFKATEAISDQLILIFISTILIIKVFMEFKETLDESIGKRIHLVEEEKIKEILLIEFPKLFINDVYVEYHGRTYFVQLEIYYEGTKSSEEFLSMELLIKEKLKDQFGEVFLRMYFMVPGKPLNIQMDH